MLFPSNKLLIAMGIAKIKALFYCIIKQNVFIGRKNAIKKSIQRTDI